MERNLDILRPSMVRKSVADIDFKELHSYGLTRVIIDLDGTLAPNLSYDFDEAAVYHLLEARTNGWIVDICLLSNCAFPFLEPRVKTIAQSLNMKHHACYWPNPMKPDAAPFMIAMNLINGTAQNTVVIGDQLEKDILGGNMLDLTTILVQTVGETPLWKKAQHRSQEKLLAKLGIKFTE